MEKKGSILNHSNKEIFDYTDNPGYTKKTIAATNPEKNLNIEYPGTEDQAVEIPREPDMKTRKLGTRTI